MTRATSPGESRRLSSSSDEGGASEAGGNDQSESSARSTRSPGPPADDHHHNHLPAQHDAASAAQAMPPRAAPGVASGSRAESNISATRGDGGSSRGTLSLSSSRGSSRDAASPQPAGEASNAEIRQQQAQQKQQKQQLQQQQQQQQQQQLEEEAAAARLRERQLAERAERTDQAIHLRREATTMLSEVTAKFTDLGSSLSDLFLWKDSILGIAQLPAASLSALAIISSELYRRKCYIVDTLANLASTITTFMNFELSADDLHAWRGARAAAPLWKRRPPPATPEEQGAQPPPTQQPHHQQQRGEAHEERAQGEGQGPWSTGTESSLPSPGWVLLAARARLHLQDAAAAALLRSRALAERDLMRAMALFYVEAKVMAADGPRSPIRGRTPLQLLSRGHLGLSSRGSMRRALDSRGSAISIVEEEEEDDDNPPLLFPRLTSSVLGNGVRQGSGFDSPSPQFAHGETLPALPALLPPSRDGMVMSMGLLPTKELMRLSSEQSKMVHAQHATRMLQEESNHMY